MSKSLELTEEQHRILEHAAETRGMSAAEFLAVWIDDMAHPDRKPRCFDR